MAWALLVLSCATRVSENMSKEPVVKVEPVAARPVADADGAAPRDRDHDDIADESDACPELPEDRDGFDDRDGCPDRDNDGDGILDAARFVDGAWINCDGAMDPEGDVWVDCRDAPESFNGAFDDDGCPERRSGSSIHQWRSVGWDDETSRSIELDVIEFTCYRVNGRHYPLVWTGGRLALSQEARAGLPEVVRLLEALPNAAFFVDAHTDGRAAPQRARRQTQALAEAYVDQLVALGIDRARLRARGFGGEMPIALEDTSAGRRANRRIELNFGGPLDSGEARPRGICELGTSPQRAACGCEVSPAELGVAARPST